MQDADIPSLRHKHKNPVWAAEEQGSGALGSKHTKPTRLNATASFQGTAQSPVPTRQDHKSAAVPIVVVHFAGALYLYVAW
jgi:hypothetical protein